MKIINKYGAYLILCLTFSTNALAIEKQAETVPAKTVENVGFKLCGDQPDLDSIYAPHNTFTYKGNSQFSFNLEIDDELNKYSYNLVEWILREARRNIPTIESTTRFGEISKATITWNLTASSHTVGNVIRTSTAISKHHPNGVTTNYTYLYNRASDTMFDLDDIFINRKKADPILRKILIDKLLILRKENLGETSSDWYLKEDTEDRIADEIFGALDIELFNLPDTKKFEGIRISIHKSSIWSHFHEANYDVDIKASEFLHLLKPVCRDIFVKN